MPALPHQKRNWKVRKPRLYKTLHHETWCITCEEREKEKIDKEYCQEDESTRRKMYEKIRLHKYIGESSRSMYERGLEHQRDLEEMKKESHMLKHNFDKHAGEDLENMKFGARIVKAARSAFNRQICESVQIQQNAKEHHILNSKSEYNRCALPRLTAKLGEFSLDGIEKEKRREKEEEKELVQKIRALKMKRSEDRREIPRDTHTTASPKEEEDSREQAQKSDS